MGEPIPGAQNRKRRSQRLASYGVIVQESHILLCRLAHGFGSGGKWTLPGGGHLYGEHPQEAMIREVHEETGFHVRPEGLLEIESEVFDLERRMMHAVRFYFEATIIGGKLRHEVNESTDLCDWIQLDQLSKLPTVPIVYRGLALLKGEEEPRLAHWQRSSQ